MRETLGEHSMGDSHYENYAEELFEDTLQSKESGSNIVIDQIILIK